MFVNVTVTFYQVNQNNTQNSYDSIAGSSAIISSLSHDCVVEHFAGFCSDPGYKGN